MSQNEQQVDMRDQVNRALNRACLLYRHFAETIERELGREEGRKLVRKAVDSYGAQVGRDAAARTMAQGLPLTPENFSDDLPTTAWVMESVTENGENVCHVKLCPMADAWKDMDPELARIYCYVDQAKMQAYNPDYTYVHLSNQLDGDEICRLVVRKK